MADPTPQQLHDACGVAPSWICEKTYQATGSNTWAHLVDWVVAKPLTIALIIVAAAIINRILHHTVQRMVDRVTSNPATSNPPTSDPEAAVPPTLLSPRVWNERREARANTLGSVLRSTTSIVVWVTALFAGFGVLNINLGPLIAGAGIAGIALGFGAQSLVKDIVTGIFMLAEDQYGVGDVVDLGDAVGTVEKVSIRSTRLRDVYGVVWYVPNGEIARVRQANSPTPGLLRHARHRGDRADSFVSAAGGALCREIDPGSARRSKSPSRWTDESEGCRVSVCPWLAQ